MNAVCVMSLKAALQLNWVNNTFSLGKILLLTLIDVIIV